MNKEIRDWACSLSGCDGGNIDADIWLCGIEWGGGSHGNYYTDDLPKEINQGEVVLTHDKHNWKDSITYPYGLSFAKLYTAINGGKVENYKEVENLNGKELFKLNLYPIAFNSTAHNLWHENNLDEITGFENKHLFNTWCFFNRFPAFSKLTKEHKPKLIIGTGVGYLLDFLMFFGGGENTDKLHSEKIVPKSESNKSDRTFYWVNLDGNTLLVVIPFFSGRYGLNSNYLLQEMGSRISKLLEQQVPS
jgi:hypothetical protein